MKFDFLKTPTFILGGLLLIIFTIFAVININIWLGWKIIIVCAVFVIYSINQFYSSKKISEKIKAKIISTLLKSIDQFRQFIPEQKLRSNIFFLYKKGKGRVYRIKYSYNMDESEDKNIEIPENLGCTGEAWRTKHQVFGTQEKIFRAGEYKVPEDQLKKVPSDLKWICSTPILDYKGDVIGVMNFDGNRELNPDQIEQIKGHCQRTSEELKEILLEL